MKNRILVCLLLGFSFNTLALVDHSSHAKHNMILFGDKGHYYASHIVYKAPHNFQVILKLELNSELDQRITAEKSQHPSDEFIYLLDHMDISQIKNQPSLLGQVFRISADGTKQIISEKVGIMPSEYSVIYFDELPLSLQAD